MSLRVGDRLGCYEVLAPIGAGGMGEVYRARDTNLKRDVALKVLPEAFARDLERMARFQREAEVLASLNHPNIAAIYGVEERALVMELVEGEPPKGPLPFDDTWKIASQIVAALEYAHERGIMHRDLKPANILITPEGVVKLLDFGLAKAFTEQREPSASPEHSPTLTLGATEVGVILGTAAYMAPEQARGKVVDKRADIWSFGVVLYELLSGERLFTGEDAAETLAAVIHKQPNLAKAPRQARRLLEECLQKDPKQRLRDIGDAKRLLIDAAVESKVPRQVRRAAPMRWVIAAGLFIVVACAALLFAFEHRRKRPVGEVVRFQIAAPEKTTFENYVAPSPDGRRLAFTATGADGRPYLWVRSLDSLDTRLLSGTANASGPFWSPDSRFIAFGDGNKLKKVDVTGGPPLTLCELPNTVGSGAWNQAGILIFGARGAGGLNRVSAAGGVATPVTELDSSRQEGLHSFPAFLPDGRHFIYLRTSALAERHGIYVGSLDTKPEQQASKRLLAVQYGAAYAPTADSALGRLLFLREGTLMTQPFDSRRLELVGEPVPVAEQVGSANAVQGHFGVSASGVLAYRTGAAGGGSSLTWYDRQGKVLGAAAEPSTYGSIALSPDGMRMAVSRDLEGSNIDIWLIEFDRAARTRFTFDAARDFAPIWSPNGGTIVFRSDRSGGGDLYQKTASGAGSDEVLLKSPGAKTPDDWSRDGRFLLYSAIDPKTKSDLWILPLQGDHKPIPYLKTEFNEAQGQFSPDGRFVAYRSDESGQSEIYVQPFPAASGGGGKWMVSSSGGTQPRWRRDGKELFYIANDRMVMAVDVNTSPAFKAGIPHALFERAVLNADVTFRWDVTADGKRFLLNTVGAETAVSSPITVVLNWYSSILPDSH